MTLRNYINLLISNFMIVKQSLIRVQSDSLREVDGGRGLMQLLLHLSTALECGGSYDLAS